MRILAPYCSLNTRVVRALEWYANDVEFVYTGKTRTDYWKAIAERWQGKEDLVIIEQDIEISEEVMAEFASCPEPWCVFWYQGGPMAAGPDGMKLRESLGCVRFSADLQKAVAHERISRYPEQQSWDIIDTRVAKMLKHCGYTAHVHGQVRHFHMYEMIFIESPSNLYRRYTWRHVNRGEYPSVAKQSEQHVTEDNERLIIDCSRLENEAE